MSERLIHTSLVLLSFFFKVIKKLKQKSFGSRRKRSVVLKTHNKVLFLILERFAQK